MILKMYRSALLLFLSSVSLGYNSSFMNYPLQPRFSSLKLQPPTPLFTCTSSLGIPGNCVGIFTCLLNSGSLAGKCGLGLKTCCAVSVNGGRTSLPNARFVNSAGQTSGTFSVSRISSDFCQLRIDLDQFRVGTIDSEGQCTAGVMRVSGQSDPIVPEICGENMGQHLYVNFDSVGSAITIFINGAISPSWDIRTTQIACSDTENLAPSGCLQFFNTASGTVKSFGYQDKDATSNQTFQLSDLNYRVCIGTTSQFSSVRWSRGAGAADSFFSLTLASPTAVGVFGSVALAVFDANCTTDYVDIIGGSYTDFFGDQQTASRFCGLGFPTVFTSSSTQLLVRTNSVELSDGDQGNAGFFLSFFAL